MAYQAADIAEAVAEINQLSTEELKELCNSTSDEKYDQLVAKSQKVKAAEAERDMLMASVRSLAEFNLARQNDYESDRSRLLELVGDSNRLKEEIQNKATKLLELSKRTSLESTLAAVTKATAEAEEDSEKTASKLLDNTIDYDTFISEFIEKRKLLHLRRIKTDRLRQETNESWACIRSQSFGASA